MISGIKRKTTAAESQKRFFQTVNLIISHLKRDADKQKIFELIEENATLNDLLIATAAVHIYHNFGLRNKNTLDISQVSVESTKHLEVIEKKSFAEEISILLKDSLKMEIDLLYKKIDLENKVYSLLIKERMVKLQKFERNRLINEIEDDIEKILLEIIVNYPPYYFYDLIGDLIGLTEKIKTIILEESSAFKELSVEIERKLESEEKEDKFIELATLNRLVMGIHKEFEIRSYKELQVQSMPVRMLKKRIIEYLESNAPISIPGLKTYQEVNLFKKEVIQKIEITLEKTINYDDFESEISSFFKKKLIEKLKTNPNDFMYFLQKLNENNFSETTYMLNKYGVYNTLQLLNIDEEIVSKLSQNMIRYNIDKFTIMALNDSSKNVLYKIKKLICESAALRHCYSKIQEGSYDLVNVLLQDSRESDELWREIKANIKITKNELKEFIQKRNIINKVFIDKLGFKSYSQILVILNFEEIINNLVKDTFFYLFSKIIRQLSRIIETYLKISNDKSLFLVALRKMLGTTESEKWVWIKLEELLIERIVRQQKELVVIFNALNQPFLVNGFILARLTDKTLKEGIQELKNDVSPIYEDVKDLALSPDIISPISYCIGYDLIKRFENFEELRKLKVEQIIELKEKKKEEKKKKLREQQEGSTLNSIERRITSSLMRINSPGINPNQLYWQEKDTKIVTENLKLHSELKGDTIDLFTEYFHFTVDKIKKFAPNMRLPDDEKLKQLVINLINKILESRLGHAPTVVEIENMVDGERYEISKQIAIRIGKFLDKALYMKFKNKHKNG